MVRDYLAINRQADLRGSGKIDSVALRDFDKQPCLPDTADKMILLKKRRLGDITTAGGLNHHKG